MRRLFAAAASITLLAACSSSPSIDAEKVLRDGAAAMSQVKTVSAILKIVKGTISLQGFALVSAKTAVRLPADSDTTYTVKQQDISFSLEVVITGGHTYLHLPLTPLQEASATEAAVFPDMAKLFDPATGLPAVIPAGAHPQYVSTDTVGGQSAYQIATSYTPDQIRGLLAQLSSNATVTAHVWVGVSNHEMRKALLAGAFGDNGKQATVEVDITAFDAPVTITSPSP